MSARSTSGSADSPSAVSRHQRAGGLSPRLVCSGAPTHDRTRSLGRLVFVALACGVVALSGCNATGGKPGQRRLYPLPGGERTIRAVWVTRWDFKSPADIARVMDNCKAAGFNTVLFQVRGAGTVCYRSRLEPWAEEFGGVDPGFDPLAVACAEGHKRGLAVHAWVNVVPGYRGDGPPRNPKQLLAAHPDWFWRDAQGKTQPFGWYQSVNPCYPEVRKHIVGVMHEIVANYQVDGVHMDYIRFPNEWNDSYAKGATVPDYPRDPRTLAMFKKETGLHPDQSKQRWDDWRTAQLNQLVREVRGMMMRTKPQAWLTAAVGSMPDEHRRVHYQDSRRWLAEGLIDAAYPMNYAADARTFDERMNVWLAMRPRTPVITGIMFDKREPNLVRDQVNRTQRLGGHFAAFAYNSLFERFDKQGRPMMDNQSASRATLRQQIIPHMRRMAGVKYAALDSANQSRDREGADAWAFHPKRLETNEPDGHVFACGLGYASAAEVRADWPEGWHGGPPNSYVNDASPRAASTNDTTVAIVIATNVVDEQPIGAESNIEPTVQRDAALRLVSTHVTVSP